MIGDKTILEDAIKNARNQIKEFDGISTGQTNEDAIKLEAELIAKGVQDYIESITFGSTPENVVSAAMVAMGNPVTSTNILKVKALDI